MDMRDISYREEFDIVLNWYTSFGYFTDEENKKVLRNFYNVLTRNGILIIDSPSYWSPMVGAALHGDKYIEITSLDEVEKYKFHYKAKMYKIDGDDSILSKVDEVEATIIIYPPEILREMLENTGFKILYAFVGRSFNSVPFTKLNSYNVFRSGIRRIVWLVYKP